MRAAESTDRGLRIARISGIQVVLHWSLVVIFGLIVVSLATAVFPSWHPDWRPALSWSVALLASLLFFGSILLHELAHALVGRRNGMPVRRITLFMFGGVAEAHRSPRTPGGELWTAAVGPLTSILIGILATFAGALLAMRSLGRPGSAQELVAASGPVATLLLWLGPINVLLAVFNLIPGFPLDGGRVLRALLWRVTGDEEKATRWASGVGRAVGWMLIVTGLLMTAGLRVPLFGTGIIPGLWMVLIGWFLQNAARASHEDVVIRHMLEHVPVRALMRADLPGVDPNIDVESLVSDYFMRFDQRAFPVIEGDRIIGMVALENVRGAPRDRWPQTAARDIMTATSELDSVGPRDPALSAFERLIEADAEQIPVVEGGRIEGVVRRADVMKWLTLHTSLAR